MKAKSRVAKTCLPDVFDVLDGCHRDILIHLDKLIAVVSHLQLAAPNEKVREHAHEVVEFFSGPARQHNYDEERHVFPTLMACDDPEVKRAAEGLCEDHAWIEFCWLDIEPHLAAAATGLPLYDLPALRSAAEAFVTVTREHVALEESLLYPQLRGRLKLVVRKSMSVKWQLGEQQRGMTRHLDSFGFRNSASAPLTWR